MSVDIDMQTYAGGNSGSAAVGQQEIGSNFYQQETGEQPLHPELLGKQLEEVEPREEKQEEPEVNPQAEHFRALREEMSRIKAEKETEKREYQLQLDMLKANLAQQHATKTA